MVEQRRDRRFLLASEETSLQETKFLAGWNIALSTWQSSGKQKSVPQFMRESEIIT